MLRLDPGHEFEGDVLDVEVGLPALEVNLAGERAAGQDRSRIENRVDRGGAHAERAQKSLEHHRGVHSLRVLVSHEIVPSDQKGARGRQ